MQMTLRKSVGLLAAAGAIAFLVKASAARKREAADPRLDPQMKAVLDELQRLGVRPFETLTPNQARGQPTPADAVQTLLMRQGKNIVPEAVAKVEDRQIDGPAGKLPIRIYTPKGDGPFPVIVYFHGGGWVIADLDTYDATPRALANIANAVVVSAHYRQGPEHRFPAAHSDAFAAYQWTLAHAGDIRGDAARIAVAGESAGGNLAASVAIMARNQDMPMPVHQLLIYPVTNYDFDSPSYIENAEAKPLSRDAMRWFFQHYLNWHTDGESRMISLVREPRLQGLPPATVITAQIDPLRSEGKEYADNLREAGVPVNYRDYEGVTHEFFGMGAVLDQAREAQHFAAEGLHQAFSASPVRH
jgi:acetyl esterase/lipase